MVYAFLTRAMDGGRSWLSSISTNLYHIFLSIFEKVRAIAYNYLFNFFFFFFLALCLCIRKYEQLRSEICAVMVIQQKCSDSAHVSYENCPDTHTVMENS